jgi:hypothetical protein
VVSDHGPDLAKGIRLFRQEHPRVVDTYDVTHRLACLVKEELEPDPRWEQLLRHSTQTMLRLQQTEGAFLKPPAPRSKARYLNLEPHVQWAKRMLALLDTAELQEVAGLLQKSPEQARRWLEDKLGWLRDFRDELASYDRLLQVALQTQEEVKNNGLRRRTWKRLWRRLGPQVGQDSRVRAVLGRVLRYLKEQGARVPRGQAWLGTTDVLESLFGKYKYLLEKAPSAEVGASVLTLPVLTTELTGELVRQALQTVRGKDLARWLADNVGCSTLAKVRALTDTLTDPAQAPLLDTEPG